MYVEIVDSKGNTIGAVNTDCCDLIRIDPNDPRKAEGGALMRSYTSNVEDANKPGEAEVYKSKLSYLRLIEVLTQQEIKNIATINEVIRDIKDEDDAPKIVIPGQTEAKRSRFS